ncbi:MAG: FAD-dependent oxidoreductase, partial [Oscillospiraceae bacterium]
MAKVIIVGSGPAGVSASLYIKRGGIDVQIIGKDMGALAKAEKIENYYGFENGISGKDLIETGINQAKNLGVEVTNDEVVGISYDGDFIVKTKQSEYKANALVMATGTSRKAPSIKGLAEFEGRGVSYCAVCDAFFYRKKDVAILGNGEYALNEANEIANVASIVTILTNGNEPDTDFGKYSVVKTEISEITGDGKVEKVLLKDGTEVNVSGIFVAVGTASTSDLARKIGAFIENNKIIVNDKM